MSDELMHFGVKGMKWGVRRDRSTSGGSVSYGKQKKQLRAERDQKQQKSMSALNKAERAHDDLVSKIQRENRAKGMGRIEATRAAWKDPRAKKSWDKLTALEDRSISKSKNADEKYKSDVRSMRNSPEYKARMRKRGMVAAGTVMATAGLIGYGVVAKRYGERSAEKSIVSELLRLQKINETADTRGEDIGAGMARYGSGLAYDKAIQTIRNRTRR